MKTIQELMELVNQAIISNADKNQLTNSQLFIDYSPHINQLSMRFYMTGWKRDNEAPSDACRVNLSIPEEIQEAYWFIYNRKSFIF